MCGRGISDPRSGSLCSGYGGLDLAVAHVTGHVPAWHCENDSAPARVLAAHWPDVPNLGDLTRVDWATVAPVHTLTAGYPCQPFSLAGQRRGTTDDRHLWPYIATAVRRIRPRLVVLENVPGHRSMGFGSVLADMARIGYDARWASVRASDIGAPHERERVFIVAAYAAGETGDCWAGLCEGDPQELFGSGRFDDDARAVAGDAYGARLQRQGERGHGTDERATGTASVGTGTNWQDYAPAIRRWERITGRPAPAPVDAGRRGGHQLSPRFTEWLMGLPAGWVTDVAGLTRTDQLRTLGRGVVPQQAVAALRVLLS